MNGNDLLEYEEAHWEELYEAFVVKHPDKYENFSNVHKHDENLEENFIDFVGQDVWSEFVMESFNNSMASQADMLSDMEKDRQMGL